MFRNVLRYNISAAILSQFYERILLHFFAGNFVGCQLLLLVEVCFDRILCHVLTQLYSPANIEITSSCYRFHELSRIDQGKICNDNQALFVFKKISLWITLYFCLWYVAEIRHETSKWLFNNHIYVFMKTSLSKWFPFQVKMDANSCLAVWVHKKQCLYLL